MARIGRNVGHHPESLGSDSRHEADGPTPVLQAVKRLHDDGEFRIALREVVEKQRP
jgi:hypothetical protein